MDLTAYIFDLDGTLIHTIPQFRYELVGNILKELEIPPAQEEDIDAFWFEHERNKIVREKFGVAHELFWPVYHKHDTVPLRRIYSRPYKDVTFLKELKAKGKKIGLFTGAPEHIAELEIGLIGKNLFDEIIIARAINKIKQKPNAEGLILCLNKLKTPPDKALYIGNAEEDVLAAEQAGVSSALIDRGEYPFDHLQPTIALKSLYDLREYLCSVE